VRNPAQWPEKQKGSRFDRGCLRGCIDHISTERKKDEEPAAKERQSQAEPNQPLLWSLLIPVWRN
jgi:hypothetical protein